MRLVLPAALLCLTGINGVRGQCAFPDGTLKFPKVSEDAQIGDVFVIDDSGEYKGKTILCTIL